MSTVKYHTFEEHFHNSVCMQNTPCQPQTIATYIGLRLSPEEIENPFLSIEHLFEEMDLSTIKQILWEFLKAAVTSNHNKYLSKRDRREILYLYEHLERLLEAAHLINEGRSPKPCRASAPAA